MPGLEKERMTVAKVLLPIYYGLKAIRTSLGSG